MEEKIFLKKIKNEVPGYLSKLYVDNGFFAYSLGNDIYPSELQWGLGNSVYAIKALTFVKADGFLEKNKGRLIERINLFAKTGGKYSDPLVARKIFWRIKLAALKNWSFANFWAEKTIMAETRQAIVALQLLGANPTEPYINMPYNQSSLDKYIKSLHWNDAWAATSHINHEVFFLKLNSDMFSYKNDISPLLLEQCFRFFDSIQQENGMWCTVDVSTKQKVNAAMKVISAYNLMDNRKIPKADKIVDFVLNSISEEYYFDACDNLNAMFVLYYAFMATECNYREEDVKSFVLASIRRWQKYFFDNNGGFSFVPNDQARRYYGFTTTRPFWGPDVHGTMLFTWACSFAANILSEKDMFNPDIIN